MLFEFRKRAAEFLVSRICELAFMTKVPKQRPAELRILAAEFSTHAPPARVNLLQCDRVKNRLKPVARRRYGIRALAARVALPRLRCDKPRAGVTADLFAPSL